MTLTATTAVTVPLIRLTFRGKQLGRVIATRSAIGAATPIVIAPAVTLRALLWEVPFMMPLPLAFPLAIYLSTAILAAIFTMMMMMTLFLTLLILVLTVLTVTITTPVLLSILRGLSFTTSDLASLLRVNFAITIRCDRPALLAVRFSLPLLLIDGRRGHGAGRPVLAGDISI